MDFVQNSLFNKSAEVISPLAERIRPRNLDEYVGQEHLIGKGKLLRRLIETDNVTSMILWGPPGIGKTTLAMIIASMTNSCFVTFSAVTSGIKEIKEVMVKAESNRFKGLRTILFVDEIHRFNKAQQDAFLPHVERGNITLIGATTQNPSFEVNSALISRCRVFVLKPLNTDDIAKLIKNTINDKRAWKDLKINISENSIKAIATYSDGDARCALNTLEIAVKSGNKENNVVKIDNEILEQCMQKKALLYDKSGEEHYNIISALHKSMRNSDCDAAVYWLARMLEAGEEPLYIARRIIQFASEDIGLADPEALKIAVAAFQASHFLGMPECSINLTEAVVYMASAPKSNALYTAYNKAKADAINNISEGVPLNLRNPETRLMSNIGYGKGYKYAHDYKEKMTNMQCLPDNLKDRIYYEPTSEGHEKKIKERIEYIKNVKNNINE